MSYGGTGSSGLDYEICEYEGSRLKFRGGPKYDLSKPYVAFLGTTETFGKFVERPFPELLAQHLSASPVNLGLINGGTEAYLSDPEVMKIAKQAKLRVMQVIGAPKSSGLRRNHTRRSGYGCRQRRTA
jgi:hypothetical protein